MPAVSLPVAIEPFKWADRSAHVAADVPLASFTRLSEDLLDTEGEVKVDVRLERDAQHVVWLRGALETTIHMACQRCLESVALPLSVAVNLALLRDEEYAERLSDETDYLVVAEHDVSLADILEDELLLVVPYTPTHDTCEMDYVPSPVDEEESPRENPFQVLAALKKPPANE